LISDALARAAAGSSSPSMETLTEVVRSSKQIKIQGFSLTSAMSDGEVLRSSVWNACGYKWEVHVLPTKYFEFEGYSIALNLYFRDEVPKGGNVKATFLAIG
jgi:speckle-type POZ protein